VEWDRQKLIDAFESDETADLACRRALESGALFLPPSDAAVDTAHLVKIYSRRAEHLAERAIPTLGFEEAIARLARAGGSVRAGEVHTDEFNFVFWLQPVESVVVSCLGVAASAANPDWDYSNWSR
jgi:hypothetical protein